MFCWMWTAKTKVLTHIHSGENQFPSCQHMSISGRIPTKRKVLMCIEYVPTSTSMLLRDSDRYWYCSRCNVTVVYCCDIYQHLLSSLQIYKTPHPPVGIKTSQPNRCEVNRWRTTSSQLWMRVPRQQMGRFSMEGKGQRMMVCHFRLWVSYPLL